MGDPRNKKVRTQHVERIHRKKAEVANQIGANGCPKCGGEPIMRKGKYGDFKGYNNYPKCGFTITN
ncbi:MAG TPA: topoisomerase DNA-binding C4 zinc finger domain-containing protein [Desulfosporosinus sp.]|nr:topoisomerase DNA-binding C4 zinc finger domain-containing protein [Desulfosporosinus sp.]